MKKLAIAAIDIGLVHFPFSKSSVPNPIGASVAR